MNEKVIFFLILADIKNNQGFGDNEFLYKCFIGSPYKTAAITGALIISMLVNLASEYVVLERSKQMDTLMWPSESDLIDRLVNL